MSKFTPKIQETRKTTKDNKIIDKPASFAKLPPLIPVKTLKEVNEISKFFKKNTKPTEKKNIRKSENHTCKLLQTQVLRVKQVNKPCIRLTQENSIEFLVQCIYLYIITSDGLCSTISSLF